MGGVTRALRDAADRERRRRAHRRAGRAHRRARRAGARRHARVGRRAARRRRRRGDASEDHVPRSDRPRRAARPTSSNASNAGRSRSGTVKVNVAVDRLPEFTAQPGLRSRSARRHDRARRVARRHRRRVPGRGRGPAGRACRSPTSASRRCSTRRSRPRASTSCRCSRSGCRTRGRRNQTDASSRRTPTASIARVDAVAPGFTDSILHRQVIGPYEMEHEYGLDRRQHLPRRAVARPDVPHATRAGLRRLPHADRGSLPSEQRDARRRRRDRHPRSARDASDHAR